ncbi:MAG: methyltransferase domain-containing protein [Burkholderiaceae bacterium]
MPVPPSHDGAAAASAPIDLRTVRALFRDPGRIADSAFLRQDIGARMRERMELIKLAPQSLLDAGCGPGSDFAALQAFYPEARVVGLDASPTMLAAASREQAATKTALRRILHAWLPRAGIEPSAPLLVCGDFAALPLRAAAVDLLWSNLALHWHPRPDQVFGEWHRVIRTDGLLMFSCFGPDTFKELRAAFAGIDAAPHTLPFVDMHDLGDMLVHAGFATPVMDMEIVTVTYESADRLLAEARAWGGNPLADRRRSLIGRKAWARIRDALEGMRRDDGRIPLTCEVVYGHAFRPAPSRTAEGETIIRFAGR